MDHIPTSDLNRRLSAVLAEVEQGKSFALTRYSKVVAHLVPATDADVLSPEQVEELVPVPMNRQPHTSDDTGPKYRPGSWQERNQAQAARDDLLRMMGKKAK